MHITIVSLLLIIIDDIAAVSSPLIPFIDYNYSISMQQNVSDLWWNVNEVDQEIVFELHVKTVGWIALGISPAGGMTGADICLSWVDQNGRVYIQDRYALNNSKPMTDTTSTDWIALAGRQMNGWTAIQFKRKFDTCDSMDVPIRTGTNQVIYAYGLVDPDPTQSENEIAYHENRRGTRIISLRSFTATPMISKYNGLDTLDFLVDNFPIPTTDTTYYCQVFRTPRNFTRKRHAIAYEMRIDSNNVDLVHHILLYECSQTVRFNDSMLPKGLCNVLHSQINNCMMNAATGWAIGGDTIIDYPEEAGYPFQTNFSVVYYLMQMHYSNPQGISNRVDRSGIRFILGTTLRQYDVGYLTLGANTDALALAIPPQIKEFHVDYYCPSEATMSIPDNGIIVFGALPHTHLQGRSIWTTLFRNGTPIEFLHNAQAYDFNHQIVYNFPKPITLYPGDTFYTRCVYNTMNKNTVTLGGESTSEEMCLHFFAYYPRLPTLYTCINMIAPQAWTSFANITLSATSYSVFRQWLLQLQWTDTLSKRWQQFYDNASRLCIYGDSAHIHYKMLNLPPTPNLDVSSCIIPANNNAMLMHFSLISHAIILLCFQVIILMN